MNDNADVRIMINTTQDANLVEENIRIAVGDILDELKDRWGIEYTDTTMCTIYNMIQTFSRQLNDVLASENTGREDNLFGTETNANYFDQTKTW